VTPTVRSRHCHESAIVGGRLSPRNACDSRAGRSPVGCHVDIYFWDTTCRNSDRKGQIVADDMATSSIVEAESRFVGARHPRRSPSPGWGSLIFRQLSHSISSRGSVCAGVSIRSYKAGAIRVGGVFPLLM
jgi:hypothetical protein